MKLSRSVCMYMMYVLCFLLVHFNNQISAQKVYNLLHVLSALAVCFFETLHIHILKSCSSVKKYTYINIHTYIHTYTHTYIQVGTHSFVHVTNFLKAEREKKKNRRKEAKQSLKIPPHTINYFSMYACMSCMYVCI